MKSDSLAVLDRAPEIVDAAAELFYANGYKSTSVQDVAAAVGILKGSLYYYISTKEDLLYAVVTKANRAMVAVIDEIDSSPEPAIARVRRFLDLHLDLLLKDRATFGVAMHDYRALRAVRGREATRTRDRYADCLQALLEAVEIDSQGTLAGADARLTCLGILGMLNWSSYWYRPQEHGLPDRVSAGLSLLALRSLRPVSVER